MKSILLISATGMTIFGPFASRDTADAFVSDLLEPTLNKADPNGNADVTWAILPYVDITGDDGEGAVSDVLTSTVSKADTQNETAAVSPNTSSGAAA